MEMNKLEFLNLFRNGIVVSMEKFSVKSYEKMLKTIDKIKSIIHETENNSKKLNILNAYTITSIDNRKLISNLILGDYDILIKLLDDSTLNFLISTEILSFLNVDENSINGSYIEDEEEEIGGIIVCDNIQFITLLDCMIESITYEIQKIQLNDNFIQNVIELGNDYPSGKNIVTEQEFYGEFMDENGEINPNPKVPREKSEKSEEELKTEIREGLEAM